LTSNAFAFLPAVVAADTAWLFPGQGAQEVGMGADLWSASTAARAVFDTADAVLGYEISRLCFEGPEEALRETEHSQPAILTVSLACLAAAVESGQVTRRPAFMAGHSLGEYSALVAAGSLGIEDGFRLVQERGRLMAAAGKSTPGTMAAILGLTEEAVEEICRRAGAEVCNLNLPSQTVIGGSPAAVEAAMALARAAGARSTVELRVSAAFHTSMMRPARDGLSAALGKTLIRPPEITVIANSSARSLDSAAAVASELADQVARPVHWHRSVSLMAAAGVSTFIEFGPGRVLTGLARRVVPGARLVNFSGAASAERAAAVNSLPA
jgi:[acyl-carrier-protein] S-malonyltransferase